VLGADQRAALEVSPDLRGGTQGEGMPVMRDGQQAWLVWLRQHPHSWEHVRGALVESVDLFKQERWGIDLLGEPLAEMSKQEYLLR